MIRFRPWLWLLGILLIAAFLRFWRIDSIPPGFHLDESFEGLEAWRILTDPSYRPLFLAGNFGVPPLNSYANALMFAVFRFFGGHAGPVAMRVTAGCFGLLGVLAIYALAQELQLSLKEPFKRNDQSAIHNYSPLPLFSAASLTVMRWHVHFSRMGIEPIIVPLIWTSATWLLLRGWRTGKRLNFVGSGVVLAAAMYTYQGAWIIPFLMIPIASILLFSNWRHVNRQSSIANLCLTAFIAALLFAPLGWFFWNHLDLLWLRPAQIAVGSEPSSAANVTMWNEAWATAKMFGPFGNPGDLDPRRNLPGQAALDLFLALGFYIGLLVALWRIRHPAYSIPIVGLVGLLLPGILSEYAPHFHRVLGAAAPVAIFCGVGFDWLWRFCTNWRAGQLALLRWATVLLLASSAMITVRDYFGRWANLPDLYYAFDVGLWNIGQWMATQPAQTPIFLTPRTLEHPSLAFALAQSDTQRAIVSFDGRHIFPLTRAASDQAQFYVAIQEEDFRTRLLLPELFPDASITQEWRDQTGKVYATAYERLPNSTAQRSPQKAMNQTVGDGIRLLGYDINPPQLEAGGVLYLQLYWAVDTVPTTDWTVFTHLVDITHPEAPPLAGFDSPPGAGSLPTTRWQAGWRILDEYQIALPVTLPKGKYRLKIGLYTSAGQHLPGDDSAIDLGTVQIEAISK
ncbi:MAG: hypothetical protein U0175_30250 [Caldilineaceae bacterium]